MTYDRDNLTFFTYNAIGGANVVFSNIGGGSATVWIKGLFLSVPTGGATGPWDIAFDSPGGFSSGGVDLKRITLDDTAVGNVYMPLGFFAKSINFTSAPLGPVFVTVLYYPVNE